MADGWDAGEDWLRGETLKALKSLGMPRDFDADDLEAFTRQLRGLDRPKVQTALKMLQDQSRFFPKPAELRQCVEAARAATAKTARGLGRVKGTWGISMVRDEEKRELAPYAVFDWIRDLYDWPDNVGHEPDHSACMVREDDLAHAVEVTRCALAGAPISDHANGFVMTAMQSASYPYQLKMVARANRIASRLGLNEISYPPEPPNREESAEMRKRVVDQVRGRQSP